MILTMNCLVRDGVAVANMLGLKDGEMENEDTITMFPSFTH